jgi:hypothetical protein
MNTQFLLKSNVDSLYKSIQERIHSQISYNIDKKTKYKDVIYKLIFKISKKDGLNLNELNTVAIQTICPFLIGKIQNTKTYDQSFSPNLSMDRMIPESSKAVKKTSTELQSYLEDYTSSNIMEPLETFNTKDNDNFLTEMNTGEYSNSDENLLQDIDVSLDDNTLGVLPNSNNDIDVSDKGFNNLNDTSKTNNLELQLLRDELKELKSQVNPDKFTNQYQVTDNTIIHKTLVTIDIVKDEEYPRSGLLFNVDVNTDFTTHDYDIRDFVVRFHDSIHYPPGTEISLEYFTITNFSLQDLTSTKDLKEIESFVFSIKGGKFESLKSYSNTRSLGNLSTIVIPNDGFGNQEFDKFVSETEIVGGPTIATYGSDQDTYTVKPKSGYIGTFREGGIIEELRIDLMGTFMDTTTNPEDGHNTWSYLHPTRSTARCSLRLMLKPPPM